MDILNPHTLTLFDQFITLQALFQYIVTQQVFIYKYPYL